MSLQQIKRMKNESNKIQRTKTYKIRYFDIDEEKNTYLN